MARRVAVFGLAMLAALVLVDSQASASSTIGPVMGASTARGSIRLSIVSDFSCAVGTGSVIGVCPKALVSREPVMQPVIRLCTMERYLPLFSILRRDLAVCGTGFPAEARVTVVIEERYDSIHLRAVADELGHLQLGLPWARCSLTPSRIAAFDKQGSWSNSLSLRGRGCV